MRPYLVLTVVVVMAVAAFGQQPPVPRPTYSGCFYGCGPYVPLVTTPQISLQQVSPNPVGASNATTGLTAGATNSTLSQINDGSTSSVYTDALWYQSGAPLTTSEVHLWADPTGREGHPMHDERFHEDRAHEVQGPRSEMRDGRMYFTGREHTASAARAASEAKGFKKAARVYTNDDVTRQNDKNGTVKYDGKTEKM